MHGRQNFLCGQSRISVVVCVAKNSLGRRNLLGSGNLLSPGYYQTLEFLYATSVTTVSTAVLVIISVVKRCSFEIIFLAYDSLKPKNFYSPWLQRFMCGWQEVKSKLHLHDIKQVGAPTVPSAVIKCQFWYWSYCVVICQYMPIYAISCHFMSFHVISCHFMSFHVISCHFMIFHVISCPFMSYHVKTCHIMS
jgi:hypothetical protein